MMEQDLIEAKKYLSHQGYGSGTNYTTNLVAVLLANYAQEQVEKFRLGAVMVRSEQLPCSHCGRPLKEHSKDSKLCPDRMKNFEQGN